jgi:exodeoxyribonuclease VII small subunit
MLDTEIGYSKSIEEIEAILQRVEDETLHIDDFLVEISRATKLLASCRSKLTQSEADIDNLMKSTAQ